MALKADWVSGNQYTAAAEDAVAAAINNLADGTTVIPRRVQTSSAATLSLTTAYNVWDYTGSATSTWTLPAVSGNTGAQLWLCNLRGSNTVTVQRAGSDQILNGTDLVNSIDVPAGTTLRVIDDGTYWLVLAFNAPAVPLLPQLDAVTYSSTSPWNHVVGAGTPYALVAVQGGSGRSDDVLSATWDSVTMPLLGKYYDANSGNQIAWFGAANAAAGTKAVTAACNNGFTGTPNLYSATYLNGTSARWCGGGVGANLYVPRTAKNPSALVVCSLTMRFDPPAVARLWGTSTSVLADLYCYGTEVEQFTQNGASTPYGGVAGGAVVEVIGQPPTTPVYDAISGITSGLTWTHTAAAHTTVLVDVLVTNTAATYPDITGITYGGSSMTLVSNVKLNNSINNGALARYKIIDATGGPKTITITKSGTVNKIEARAVSYLNVGSVGTSATMYGSASTITQSVTVAAGQLATQVVAVNAYPGTFDYTDARNINLPARGATRSLPSLSDGGLYETESWFASTTFTQTPGAVTYAGIANILSP